MSCLCLGGVKPHQWQEGPIFRFCTQELAMMRAGSDAALRRTASRLARQPTLDKGHIRAGSHMQRTSSMPVSYGG